MVSVTVVTASSSSLQWVNAVAWPAVALVGILLAAFTWRGRLLLSWIRDRLSKVEVFGIKVELTREAARETRQSADEAFSTLRRRLEREFDRLAHGNSVPELVEQVVLGSMAVLKEQNEDKEPVELRCTVHVEDGLFDDDLYQLIDYYPNGGGRGRTFSYRRGITGKVWRSREPSAADKVPEKPTTRDGLLRLIFDWGMTEAEARDVGSGRPAFLAIPLITQQGVEVGVLYMDSRTESAFGNDTDASARREAIVAAIMSKLNETGLVNAVSNVRTAVQNVSPRIQR